MCTRLWYACPTPFSRRCEYVEQQTRRNYGKNSKHQRCCMSSSQALQQSIATSSCVDMLQSTHHQRHASHDSNGLPANHQTPAHRTTLADNTRAQRWSIHSIDVRRAPVCKGERNYSGIILTLVEVSLCVSEVSRSQRTS